MLQELLASSLFGLWLLNAIVANLWPSLTRHEPRWLRGLAPGWQYFTPRPVSTRYRIFARSTSPVVGQWVEIHIPDRSGVLAILWQSQRRTGKFLLDLVSSLARNASYDVTRLKTSEAYRTGIAIAAQQLRTAERVQFAIFAQGSETLTLVLSSASELTSSSGGTYLR